MQNKLLHFETYFKEYLTRGITGGAPWKHWNYKDDIIVLGTYDLFCATKNIFYRNAILEIVKDKLLDDTIICGQNLDEVSSAKTDLIMEKLTGEERFHQRMLRKLKAMDKHPRTQSGNFIHKDIYPSQVWLDGLYMGMPIYLQNPEHAEDAIAQIKVVHEKIYNIKTGLYVHAWDEACQQEWAHPKTGLSPNVWCRAVGWWTMALVDCYHLMPQQSQKDYLKELLKETMDGLMHYQSKSKLFYQLIDLVEDPRNYPETSGSAMIAYSLMKGSRLGMLEKSAFLDGAEIIEGIDSLYLKRIGENYTLQGICGSAGLGAGPDNRTDRDGSAEYYFSEAIRPDNQHGAAACMMAYSEYVYGCD